MPRGYTACANLQQPSVSEPSVAPVKNPSTGEVSDRLLAQDGAYAVYAEHIRAPNEDDWLGLMAQHPDHAEIHMSIGAVARGRQEIGGDVRRSGPNLTNSAGLLGWCSAVSRR